MARLPIVPENWLDADQQAEGGSSAPAGSEPKAAGSKNPIGPVKGYPETARTHGVRRTTTSSLRRRTNTIQNETFFPAMRNM